MQFAHRTRTAYLTHLSSSARHSPTNAAGPLTSCEQDKCGSQAARRNSNAPKTIKGQPADAWRPPDEDELHGTLNQSTPTDSNRPSREPLIRQEQEAATLNGNLVRPESNLSEVSYIIPFLLIVVSLSLSLALPFHRSNSG